MSSSQHPAEKKIGQETGQIRSELPLDRLVPYLESHVKGYQGPLEVLQFKVGLALISEATCRLTGTVRTGESFISCIIVG